MVPALHCKTGLGEIEGGGLLVDMPTSLGTADMAVLWWLWRRRFYSDEAIRKATPRRVVYCLPMRVLVLPVGDSCNEGQET